MAGRTSVATFASPAILVVVAMFSGAIGMVGVFLDTAWHRTIGRDSFLILPHAFIYAGGIGIWITAFAAIARATLGGARDFGGPVLRVAGFVVPFGFAFAACGVMIVGLAAPVDIWWHAMFGKDALIWAFSHLMGHFGAGVTALGLLFAVSAQSGRGVFRHAGLWRLAMLLVLSDLVHRALFVLAHYTMIPESRTPDFYPFLLALLMPLVLVTAWRAVDPWAPALAALLFVGIAVLADLLLLAIDFARYTITPLVVIPAAMLTPLARRDPAGRRVLVAAVYGALFAMLATGMETLWMAYVTGRPWPFDRVLAGLPRSVVAGALSGCLGWIVGGFVRAVHAPGGTREVFGGPRRARRLVTVALLLAAVGLYSTYQPQRFGPPVTVEELQLAPLVSFAYQNAIFWEVLLMDDVRREARLAARSEGIIDSWPLPIGPAWCASTADALAAELPHVRFALQVNGTAVDLDRYPMVRAIHRGGEHCAWIGIASLAQRASENRFVYTLTFGEPLRRTTGTDRTVIDMEVVFKDR